MTESTRLLLAGAAADGHALTPESCGRMYAVALRQCGAVEGVTVSEEHFDFANSRVKQAVRETLPTPTA